MPPESILFNSKFTYDTCETNGQGTVSRRVLPCSKGVPRHRPGGDRGKYLQGGDQMIASRSTVKPVRLDTV